MTNVLLITERFYSPWSDGTVSYAKGLVDTILETSRVRKDLGLTVLSSIGSPRFPKLNRQRTQRYLETRNDKMECFYAPAENYHANLWKLVRKLSQAKDYDVVHILLPGFNPLWMRIAAKNRNIILKHIFIYPFHSGFVAERFAYNFFQKSNAFRLFNLDLAFSNKFLKEIYRTDGLAVLPPAIDVDFFCPKPKSDCSCSSLMESALKIGNINEVLQRDVVLLYMGPLLHERFDFRSVIMGLVNLRKEHGLDAGLVIVGRELRGAPYFKEIKSYINKNNLGGYVFACLKNLNETEKISLFNNVHIFIYPFPQRLCRMSVVFPPIALLESMSTGLCVVSGGLPYLDCLIKNNENGVLIKKPIDEKTFAESILNALLHRRKFSQNARLTIEQNFSIPHVSKLYADFLSRMGL